MTTEKKSAGGQTTITDLPGSENPNWVTEMHDYFHRNGFYKSQDLQRVLGDPRDYFEIQILDSLSAMAIPKKSG